MVLVIGPRLEGPSVTFLAIQTHFSRKAVSDQCPTSVGDANFR